jgi:hypothetical protein
LQDLKSLGGVRSLFDRISLALQEIDKDHPEDRLVIDNQNMLPIGHHAILGNTATHMPRFPMNGGRGPWFTDKAAKAQNSF